MPVDSSQYPVGNQGLNMPGPIHGGQVPSASWLDKIVARCLTVFVAGPGIVLRRMGPSVMISATATPSYGGGGGLNIRHYDVFPEIASSLTLIELGKMIWHSGPTDTAWVLDSFVFTDATGIPGTDETGATP